MQQPFANREFVCHGIEYPRFRIYTAWFIGKCAQIENINTAWFIWKSTQGEKNLYSVIHLKVYLNRKHLYIIIIVFIKARKWSLSIARWFQPSPTRYNNISLSFITVCCHVWLIVPICTYLYVSYIQFVCISHNQHSCYMPHLSIPLDKTTLIVLCTVHTMKLHCYSIFRNPLILDLVCTVHRI